MVQHSCFEISLKTEKEATTRYRALKKDSHTRHPENHLISAGASPTVAGRQHLLHDASNKDTKGSWERFSKTSFSMAQPISERIKSCFSGEITISSRPNAPKKHVSTNKRV